MPRSCQSEAQPEIRRLGHDGKGLTTRWWSMSSDSTMQTGWRRMSNGRNRSLRVRRQTQEWGDDQFLARELEALCPPDNSLLESEVCFRFGKGFVPVLHSSTLPTLPTRQHQARLPALLEGISTCCRMVEVPARRSRSSWPVLGSVNKARPQYDHRSRPGSIRTLRNSGCFLPRHYVFGCLLKSVDPSPP